MADMAMMMGSVPLGANYHSIAAPAPGHLGSENAAHLVNQRRFSKQALTVVSLGSDQGPTPGGYTAPGAAYASNALSDITNVFSTDVPAPGKATTAGVIFSEAKDQLRLPAGFAGAPQNRMLETMEHNTVFENDHKNLLLCAEYAPDIIAHSFREERAMMPDPDFMNAQPEVNPKMCAILIDWLVEVHMKYKMATETLYLTVNIIDRYMSLRQVKRRQLQLLGVTALFIASKYEEIDPPKAGALAYLTDNAYSRGQIIDFEFEVLNALGCDVVVVTPANFLDRLTRANSCQPVQRALVSYLVELSLTEAHMIRHTPSQLVSAAILLSNDLLGWRVRWSAAMEHHSRHSEASLLTIAGELRELLYKASISSLQSARRKYQSEKYHRVADLAFCRLRL